MRQAERVAYGILELKPHEFEELTPMEYHKLVEGYEMRSRISDSKYAYFASMMTNVHIPSKNHIKVADIMRQLHPKSQSELEKEELMFMKEWMAQGGDID